MYKIGDKVVVKLSLSPGERIGDILVVPEMAKSCGNIVTISGIVKDGRCFIEESNRLWHENMFKGSIPKKYCPKSETKLGFTGVVLCKKSKNPYCFSPHRKYRFRNGFTTLNNGEKFPICCSDPIDSVTELNRVENSAFEFIEIKE